MLWRYYNKLYSNDTGGDGIVHRDGQIYPNARRVIISDADSHVGETKSDKVRAALRTVLAADFNVPPRQQTPPPVPSALAVVNAASYLAGAPPEALASAFGTNLATRTETARTFCDLVLADRSVVVRDGNGEERLACLLYVGPNQINFQMPPGTAASDAANASIAVRDTGTNHDLAVQRPTSVPAVAPGVFSANAAGDGLASGQLLRVRDGAQELFAITDGCDFRAGDRVFAILFGTGLRFANNGAATIGGQAAAFFYIGPQGDYTGLDQVNLELNPALQGRAGLHDIRLTLNGKVANVVQLRLR